MMGMPSERDQQLLMLGEIREGMKHICKMLARPDQRYKTIAHAAEYADLSVKSIRRLIANGKLTAHRPVRGRILIDTHELDALVRGSTVKPRTGRGFRNE